MLGFEARPHPSAFVRMVAIGRLEHNLVGVADVGVPESTYNTIAVPYQRHRRGWIGRRPDAGLLQSGAVDLLAPIDTFSTNPDGHDGSYVGVDMIGQVHAKQFFFILGGTAGRSKGLAANRGFGPLENDAGLLGGVHQPERAGARAGARLHRARLHHQDGDHLPVRA